MHASLIPHADTVGSPVESIEVEVRRNGDRLWLTYLLWGNTARVLWPQPTGPVTIDALAKAGRKDELWRHTCCEAFIATDDGYREFNFATTGHWASYSFTGYRQNMTPAPEAAELVSLEGRGDCNELGFVLELPPLARRLALSAVVEDIDGVLSYWALTHPSARPDFHHPDSFILDLP